MRIFLSNYGGILVGSLYGLVMRYVFGEFKFGFADLFSITFIWIVPIILGIIPMLLANRQQLSSNFYRISRPILTVFLFFLFALWSGEEDIICIIIISIPFSTAAAISGFSFAKLIEKYRKKRGIMYSILVIPLLSGFIEERFPTPSQRYEVKTEIVINASPAKIWENIVRVKEISSEEYSKGFFNYAGIPRPLYAELNRDTIGAIRVGYFDGGLTFKERVTAWQRNKKVAFDISVIRPTIRQTVFDQHILKGDHFKFLNASYELEQLDAQSTKLTLSSTYQLDTNINGYSAFWGQTLLTDFQKRLLVVIKNRCDQRVKLP